MLKSMAKEFKAFATRGNLLQLAVAFILGVAFAALVASLIANLITPIIAAIFGKPDFSRLHFTINKSTFTYGKFINDLITFVLIVFVMFLVVKAANRMSPPPEPVPMRDCPFCKTSVPQAATRCSGCTSSLEPAKG